MVAVRLGGRPRACCVGLGFGSGRVRGVTARRDSRAVTNHYRPLLDELGITYPQYLVLLVLWERGEITVKDLGAELPLDSGTLSPLLKRLEAARPIHRTRRADDERSVNVSLTKQGDVLRSNAIRLPQAIQTAMALDDRAVAEAPQSKVRLRDRQTEHELLTRTPSSAVPDRQPSSNVELSRGRR